MGILVCCDDYAGHKFPENLETDICMIYNIKLKLTLFAINVLFVTAVYLMSKYKKRCHKTLFTFHNLRAAVALLLLAINSLELARSLLPIAAGGGNGYAGNARNYSLSLQADNTQPQPVAAIIASLQYPTAVDTTEAVNENDLHVIIIGVSAIWNAFGAILFTIMLMCYHRIVELKKIAEFLYVSATVASLIFLLRIYELSEVAYYEDLMELEFSLHSLTAFCLLTMAGIDVFTVYKERFRPDFLKESTKIGYKHTQATFYSKACFWWLMPLLWFGYKEPLELEDLGQMRLEDSARAHYDRFLLIYKTAKGKNDDAPPSLWLCYIKNSWRTFTLGGILKLFGDLFALIGPLAIQQIVQYIEILYAQHIAQQIPQSSGIGIGNGIGNTSSTGQLFDGGGDVGFNASHISTMLFSKAWPNHINDNGNSSNNNKHINIRASGSIWLSNPENNNNNNNIFDYQYDDDYYNDANDDVGDNNVDNVYNQMASNGLIVRIYYATWLDLLTNGWAVAWIVLLASLAQATLSQASTHILNMTGIRIKTSLQGLIYRKTLLLNSSCINTGNIDNHQQQQQQQQQQQHQQQSYHADAMTDTDPREVDNVVAGVKAEAGMPATELSSSSSTMTTTMQNGVNLCETLSTDDKPTASNAPQEQQQRKTQQMKLELNESSLNDVGAITNLMTEDTLNIMSFFWIAHYVWAIPLKISIVMYLLYLKLGIAAVIGAIVCIITMTPLQFIIGKAMSNNAEIIAKYTDERLKKIHDTLVGIRIIKLNAWDDVFLKKINAARNKELKYLNKDSMYWTLMTIITHISTVLITFVTLAVYVCLPAYSAIEPTASRLFSALALFQQLTVPLLIFPITVPIIISAMVSTKRLERFLHAREIQKQYEGIRNMARILSKSDASLDMYETCEKSNLTMRTAQAENRLNERLALRIHIPEKPAPLAQSEPITPLLSSEGISVPSTSTLIAANTEIDSLSSVTIAADDDMHESVSKWNENRHKSLVAHRRELLRNTPYVAIRPRKLTSGVTFPDRMPQEFSLLRARNTDSWRRDSLLLKIPDDIAVFINDGLFTWQPQKQCVQLNIKDIAIPKGCLTIIVGKNGSGKSSLLSALLMEMPLISGNMFWHKTCTISFVPQQPWLLNTSIRDNILFGESFRPNRYDFVLDACALKPDIELMPDADFTIIGERGINLSGGQRQRVAIARAIYSSANVVIMDDPLSSLDNEVAHHIFEECVRKMLLKSQRTIILVTQQLQLVQQADYLIVMKDGYLLASGGYKDIEVKHPQIITKWNSIIAKANEKQHQHNHAALGRTARERWKLFKNVSKLGLQRSISLTSETAATMATGETQQSDVDAVADINNVINDGCVAGRGGVIDADDDDDVLPTSLQTPHSSFKLTRKRSSVYGSRHLLYDMPLPIDECQTEDVILRRRRRGTMSSSIASSISQQRRSSSHASSSQRLSDYSITSGWTDSTRHSQLTASCGSALSYESSNVSVNEPPPLRVQSWQPQTVGKMHHHHQPVTRNASSPPGLQQHQQQHQPAAFNGDVDVDAGFATAIIVNSLADDAKTAVSSSPEGGFQQFLRRMSMRRSNKPNVTNIAHRKHHQRPLSETNSILSISEETTSVTATATLPSIELSSVSPDIDETSAPSDVAAAIPSGAQVTTTETTEHWLANIERHEDESARQEVLANNRMEAGTKTDTHGKQVGAAVPTTSSNGNTLERHLTKDIERKYGKISNRVYMLYIRASGIPIIVIFFLTALIWQCLRVYTDVWLQHWTDNKLNNINMNMSVHSAAAATKTTTLPMTSDIDVDADVPSHTSSSHEVTYYFCAYTAISCVCIIMAMISTPAGQWAGCNARRNLHDKLLRTIMRKTLHFFQVTPLGRIMNRFSNDMAIIDKKIAATSQRLLQFTLLCLCAILINVSVTPWFLLLTLPICAAYYAIQKFYRCSSRELQRIDNSTNTPVISHLSETIQGVTTIRAYNQQSRFTEILFKRLEANTIAFTILNTSNRWLGISLDYLGGFIVFVAIITALIAATISCSGSNMKNLKQLSDDSNGNSFTKQLSPTPSLVGLAINYTLLIPIYLNWVVKLLADMEMYAGSVERITYYAEEDELMAATTMAAKNTNKNSKSKSKLTNEADIFYYHDGDDAARADNQCACGRDSGNDGGVNAEVDDRLNAIGATSIDEDAGAADALLGNHLKLPQTLKTTTKTEAAAMAAMVVDKDVTEVTTKLCSSQVCRNVAIQPQPHACEHSLSKCPPTYKSVPISWPQRGDITFENVSLRYEGRYQNVIEQLTLHIPAGQRIGICGRTGSGKSSLALSLFGVLQTTSGRICIDDVDIAEIHPDEIRIRLSIIPQDVHLFNATIRENLDPHGYYPDLELWNCLELAQLKDFVNGQLPLGLDTEITDGGINLSAGHRQLLCLARAILRGSVCLVLDEATSTLDSCTERSLLKAAHKAFKGRTIITIAHRLSTILDYDRIIVFENGKIIEDGKPQELQHQPNSVFYTLLHSGRE